MSSVLLLCGLTLSACQNGHGGSGSDSGMAGDGGGGSDASDGSHGPPDASDGGGEPVPERCDVARQLGCDAGELCLRGELEDGGQGNRCFPGECDPVAQNCPAGDKCTYVRQGSTTVRRCVATGTVPEGGTCQSTATPEGDFYDTCQAGLYCTDRTAADGGTTFSCQKFCHASTQCTAPKDCIDVLSFTGSEELPRVCGEPGPACDPLAQGCASSLGCYPSPQSGPVCVTAGTVQDGARCAYSNDCLPGSACVTNGTGLVCRKLCRSPSGEPGCATGHCEPLQDLSGVGACVP